jgi:hypothetical protein
VTSQNLDYVLIAAEESCREFGHKLLTVPEINEDGVGETEACGLCSRIYREVLRAGFDEQVATDTLRFLRGLQRKGKGGESDGDE